MKKPLRILITNYSLAHYAGTETYVRDVAQALVRRGHNPVIYAPELGPMAEWLRHKCVPVIDDLSALREPPDIIHAQHHAESMQAFLHFPQVPAISVCHGWLPWVDRPVSFPSIRRMIAVDDQCRERLLTAPGIEASRIETHYNFVDLGKFRARTRPLPEKPARILIFNNFATTANYVLTVQAAAARHGIETVDVMGRAAGTQHSEPYLFLENYDLVFAKGRCALEAMACGCAVIINDYSGMGGLVTSDRVDELRRFNFGFRPTMAGPLTEARVYEAIGQYDAADAARVADVIRAEAGMEAAIDRLEQSYYSVLAEPFAPPPAPSCMVAAAGYIKDMAVVLREHIRTRYRAEAAEEKTRAAERAAQEANARREEAERRWQAAEALALQAEARALQAEARLAMQEEKKRWPRLLRFIGK